MYNSRYVIEFKSGGYKGDFLYPLKSFDIVVVSEESDNKVKNIYIFKV